jgi:dUTP pyrophosphatase
MQLEVKLLSELAKLPTRSHNSAGYDLYSAECVVISPGQHALVSLGIATAFPVGYVALLWDRSGMGSKGIHRFAGVIDADYRGEWKVILWNSTDKPFHILSGDKIVQCLFQRVEAPEVLQVEQLDDTSRGSCGFGSTG